MLTDRLDRVTGPVGLHRRLDQQRHLVLAKTDGTARSIGPAATLAQIHVDPGQEVAAQHLVRSGQVEQVLGAFDRQQLSGQDERLRRLRPVDQDDPGLLLLDHSGKRLGPLRHRRRLPVAEARLELRHEIGQRKIADGEDGRVVGPQPGLVEADQLVAGHRPHRIGVAGASARLPVRMLSAVERDRKRPGGDASRLGHLGSDRRELLLAEPLDFVWRESRVAGDVGKQIERRPQIGRQRGEQDRGPIKTGAGADRGAEPLLGFRQLDRIEAVSAFFEQVEHQLLSAEPVRRIGGDAGIEFHRDPGDRHHGAAGVDDLDAVRQPCPFDIGEIERRRSADRRKLRLSEGNRSKRLLAGLRRAVITRPLAGGADLDSGGPGASRSSRLFISLALAGLDPKRIDRAGQPTLHRLAHLRRRDLGELFEPGTIEVRIVGIERALGQGDGLATEAADLLEPLDPAGQGAHHGALNLIFGWAVGDEFGDDVVEPAGNRIGVLTGFHVDLDLEQAHPLERQQEAADPNRGLLLAHEDIVQTRAGEAAKHGGADRQGDQVLMGQARDDPVAVQASVGNPVLHDLVDPAGQGRHRRLGRLVHRTARNIAEVALDERASLGRIDIAGEHQNRIVGAVILTEPAADVVERGRRKIGHRSDRRVTIGMALREQSFELRIFDQAERLVVALPLLVLDDANLVRQILLGDGTEQMAHPVGLEEQGALQRRTGDRLEIIGAVEPGGTVEIGRPHRPRIFEIFARCVLRSVEHDMFEQMGKTGAARRFVLRTDIVPDGNRDNRSLAILVDDDPEAVVEGEGLMRNVDALEQLLNRGVTAGGDGLGRDGRRRRILGGGCAAGETQAGGNRQSGKYAAHETPPSGNWAES